MSEKHQVTKPAFEPFQVDDFPGLARAAKTYDEKRGTRYHQHLLTALDALNEGMEAASIRNVVYNDVKHTLGTLLSKHYSEDVRDKMRARESEWNIDTRKIMSSILMSSLTDVKSTTNKLNKIKQPGLNFDELHAFIKTHSPLVDAVDFLKGHIVKGRAPSVAPAEPANPNKVVKTCPCCFRQIAVRNDKMVHHGFERPGYGYQTQSCWGIRFAPLETSLEGLIWLIDLKTERLADRRASLKKLPNADVVFLRRGMKVHKYEKGGKDFDWALSRAIDEAKFEIKMAVDDLKMFKSALVKWQKYHEMKGDRNAD